jgi:stage 0 sporulation regulatory protein
VRRDIVTQLKEITQKIEELRTLMHQLMNEKEALTDPELVVLSQRLDELLNEYDKLVDKRE